MERRPRKPATPKSACPRARASNLVPVSIDENPPPPAACRVSCRGGPDEPAGEGAPPRRRTRSTRNRGAGRRDSERASAPSVRRAAALRVAPPALGAPEALDAPRCRGRARRGMDEVLLRIWGRLEPCHERVDVLVPFLGSARGAESLDGGAELGVALCAVPRDELLLGVRGPLGRHLATSPLILVAHHDVAIPAAWSLSAWSHSASSVRAPARIHASGSQCPRQRPPNSGLSVTQPPDGHSSGQPWRGEVRPRLARCNLAGSGE
jgi:hypothetical protein